MPDTFIKIQKFNAGLIPQMLDVKYAQMARNCYRFFRGTCHLYYERLKNEKKIPFSPLTWICGDLHMENFGSYKGDNRLVYFDLNDFDEAMLAPVSWELIHFLSSIFIAFEALGIEQKKADNMARLFLKTYSETLASGKSQYVEPQTAQGIVKEFLSVISRRKQKQLLKRRTVKKKNRRRLLTDHKHFPIDKKLKQELKKHINDWIINASSSPYNTEVVDILFRRAGIGSLGLKRYVILLKSTNVKEQYMIVDMKQSRSSALAPYLKITQPEWRTEAERITRIQQRMQNVIPALLSTTVFKNEAYVIQEMQPTKDSVNFDLIKHDYRQIYQVISDMGLLTASAQLRSSGRQGAASTDELILFGESENWQQPFIDYAIKYSGFVKESYDAFCREYSQRD